MQNWDKWISVPFYSSQHTTNGIIAHNFCHKIDIINDVPMMMGIKLDKQIYDLKIIHEFS